MEINKSLIIGLFIISLFGSYILSSMLFFNNSKENITISNSKFEQLNNMVQEHGGKMIFRYNDTGVYLVEDGNNGRLSITESEARENNIKDAFIIPNNLTAEQAINYKSLRRVK